ncbi:hypothetical protein NHJ13734_002488 [Beauveria thailandica]
MCTQPPTPGSLGTTLSGPSKWLAAIAPIAAAAIAASAASAASAAIATIAAAT